MRLPWQKSEPEPGSETVLVRREEAGRVIYVRREPRIEPPQTPAVVTVDPNDVASIARAAVDVRVAELQREAAEKFAAQVREIQRSPSYASSAIPGTPPTSPQSPLTPVAGAPYPIYAYDTPIDWATPMPPQRRPRSVVSLQTLRTIADTYDVLRACIQHLKREFLAVPFRWVPIEENDDRKGTKRQIREMQEFCSRRGGLGGHGTPRSHFECALIEDLCIIGMAACFYDRRMSGAFDAIEAIDAATIRPNVDYFGWLDKTYKWEQWVWGVMTARYTDDDLRFTGLATNARSWAPYYASPVEWLISAVNTAIRADDWDRRFFTDGNSADQVWALSDTWSPQQIMEFTAFWDAMKAGNTVERRKTAFLPGGSKLLTANTRKDGEFSELQLWLLRRTCAIMGVQPASIGYAGEQYKVSQQDSMESTSNFGVGVLLDWFGGANEVDGFYNDLARDYGCDRVRAQYVRAREEKAAERATRNSTLVLGGIKRPNEARADEGLPPDPDGDKLIVPGKTATLASVVNPPEAEAPSDPSGSEDEGSNEGGNDPNEGEVSGRKTAQRRRPTVARSVDRPTVYLIRHAMTKLNEEHRVRSWSDPKLSKKGKKLADRVGAWMVGKSLTALKVSDLKRTRQTAEHISEVTGAPIVEVSRVWRPWDLGALSGRFVDDIHPVVDDYARYAPDTAVERGESLNAFLSRFLPHLAHVLNHVAEKRPAGSLGVVTHGRNLKACLAWLSAGGDGIKIDLDEFLNYDVPMGGVLELVYDGSAWQPRMVDVRTESVPDLNDLVNGGLS